MSATIEEKRAAVALLDESPSKKKQHSKKAKEAQWIGRSNGESVCDVMPQLEATDQIMTVDEYATFTRTSAHHIYAQCRGGGITGAVKFGGTWRIVVKGGRDTELAGAVARLNETLSTFVKYHEEGAAYDGKRYNL